jgi:tetratricopeptide (TPR) repeat protein/outer membrane protein OmpA-like peptidoglycan-associated protein
MRKTLYSLLVGSVITLSGCSLGQMIKKANEQNLTVIPNPLEMHADTVEFKMSALLPVNMLKKGKIYTLSTTYKYADKEIKLDDIEFKYEDYPNQKSQQPKVTKTFSFPYSPEMLRGDLVIMGTASSANGKQKSTPEMPLALGVITTSELVMDINEVAYAPHGFTKDPDIEKLNLNFFFLQGSSALRSSEKRSDRGKQLDAYIAEKNITKTVTIVGNHSPEGLETINSRLSKDRATVVEKEYRRKMRRYDYKGMADSINFVLKPIIQDWSKFKTALAKSDLFTDDEKVAINRTIDANDGGDFRSREKSLKKLATYKKFFKEIYPDLRVAQTQIITEIPKKTDAEIAALAILIREGKAPADTLNEEELAYAATLTTDLDEMEQLYRAATKESDSWQAHNNLGAVLIQKGLMSDDNAIFEDAVNHFNISNNRKENAYAFANLGLAEGLSSGNYYKSLDYYKKALGLNPAGDLRANTYALKGVSEMKIASYQDAATSFTEAMGNPDVLYDLALANLLKKDFGVAKSGFEKAVSANDKNALAYYCSAVTAARMGELQGVTDNLPKAIQLNSDLRERAINDLEFVNYADSPEFKSAVK